MPELVAPTLSRFLTSGQGERRLWKRDCVVHGRRHTGEFCHTWFEMIGTAGGTFSNLHAPCGFAEAAGTELCKGNVEEIADVELDGADVYPLAM